MVKKLFRGWYPVNPVGRVITATYVCVPEIGRAHV